VIGPPTRVFVARLAGLPVFDPLGDRVGRVRDVVVIFRAGRQPPRAVGLVVEVPGRRRVFLPLTRVTSMDAGQVISTGLVNMRRFARRPTETLVLAELLDRTVRLRPDLVPAPAGGPQESDAGAAATTAPATEPASMLAASASTPTEPASQAAKPASTPTEPASQAAKPASTLAASASTPAEPASQPTEQASTADGDAVTVEDVAIEPVRNREWRVSKVFVRRIKPGRLRRRGETLLVDFEDLTGFGLVEQRQGAANLLAAFEELKAADLAEVVRELTPKRRLEVVSALDDERLADVLEELPEDDQVEILSELSRERAADILEAMQPDDAADLLGELPQDQAEHLLGLMEPEEAADVRRLLAYPDNTAGGMMTSEAVILPPEATVAEALARVRRADLLPALAAAVYVCRPPLETPTGTYLGLAHIQRMLREPPHEPVGALLDRDVESLDPAAPLSLVSRQLATYNLVALPVTDEDGRLIGVVTVDDVLDHLLPTDWRDAHDDLDDLSGEVPHVR
jgi:flagellar motility protein MotE (MotC chaperone)/sporulation protein YlmC with PRC-barrel domain